MQVDKQEGVYAGGKAEYTGVRSYEVYGDYQKGPSSGLVRLFDHLIDFFPYRLFG